MNKNIKILFVLFISLFGLWSCSDDTNEVNNPIEYDELPDNAKAFLKKYFYGYEITGIGKETVKDIILFEVELDEGYKIEFNSEGDWLQVLAPYGKTIPTGFIPEPIMQTLDYQYHGFGINQINITGENYHLVLSNNQGGDSIELLFNQSGEILPGTSDTPV